MRALGLPALLALASALLACGDDAPASPGAPSALGGQGGTSSGGEAGQPSAGGEAGNGLAGAVGTAGGAGNAGGPSDAGLFVGGSAELRKLDLEGLASLEVGLQVQNRSTEVITLAHSRMFFVHDGGFAFDLGDRIAEKEDFYGLSLALKPATKPKTLPLSFAWSTPVTHAVFFLEGADPAGQAVRAHAALPLQRKGFAAPKPVPFEQPVTLTLQEPLEAVQLASGERVLTVVGQIANLTPHAAGVSGLSLTIRAGDETVVTRDLLPDLLETDDARALRPFLFVAPLSATFTEGELSLAGQGEWNGTSLALERKAPITYAPALVLHAPVLGAWRWTNGQGEDVLHTHLQYPEQRYAYDLLVRQGGKTSSGPANENESYFAFGRPVLAAADGEVVLVIDDVADNLGKKASPQNDPPRNSLIVLDHGEGRHTVYGHVRKDSALVKVGQMVKVGDQIAEVGNAGFSSEPHLHFAHYVIGEAGQVRALPMRFDNLFTGESDGEAATETPRGGATYEAR